MTHFLLEYRYVDQNARMAAREEHLAYMRRLHAEGSVLLAGPIADDSGAVVVFRAADEAAAQQFVDDDPYTAAGATTGHVLREWRVVIPAQD
ncbi:MAG TPA: YciI family protein [Segeticoccus sp.]|uniref:YciI family protein n=1 Tax=Segeticoccus sp. TaxID=2706531 RepID=UPI002D7E77C5|nr:YciI family protein [Segeticoccus sp.]HET8600946.1 YciI family protein [Segeticoccus sp.]